MSFYKSFETERLYLRPTSEADAEFILELLNSPKWIENIGDRNIRTVEDAKTYIQSKYIVQLQRLGFSNYTIIRKIDDKKIGVCGLIDREGLDGIDIGFALLSDYEGKGFAFEAADKIKNLAFNEFGIKKLLAITTKPNLSSQKLLERLGFVSTETITLPNETEELLLYKVRK